MPDNSVYVSWCHRCGEENRQVGQEVKCKNCGAEYYLDWPGKDTK